MCGLSLPDFRNLYPDELSAVFEAKQRQLDFQSRESWEQTRILAAISIQPYSKTRITPASLIPLPWDDHQEKSQAFLSKEDNRKRLEELLKNRKNSL